MSAVDASGASIAEVSTEDALCEEVRAASSAGRTLAIAGGGSRAGLGAPIRADQTLAMSGFDAVELYEPGALTLVVGAGASLAMVEEMLAAEGQRLPFEPMDHRGLYGTADARPTIGGAVAVGASGPRRVASGAARDAVLGARFVTGKGEAISAGGRVMKNVTGYDLARLIAGSHGALGAITQVSLKVWPKPAAEVGLYAHGLGDADAIELLSDALSSPFEPTGAAHLPGAATPRGSSAATMVRIEGPPDVAANRARRLRDRWLAARPGLNADIVLEPSRVAADWRYVRDCGPFSIGRAEAASAVWRISTRPSLAAGLVADLQSKLRCSAFYDWGGGLVWLAVASGADASATVVRRAVQSVGGRATLVRAPDDVRRAVPVFPPEDSGVAQIVSGLKRAFDPAGVLNPGRFIHL